MLLSMFSSSKAAGGGGGPTTVYDDNFATDTSAQWTSDNATFVYDGGLQELFFTQTAAWDGIVSPEITVVDGQQYEVTVEARRVAGSVFEFQVGTTLGSSNLYNGGNSGAYPSDGSLASSTITVTAVGASLYVKPRIRGGGSSQAGVSRVTVREL